MESFLKMAGAALTLIATAAIGAAKAMQKKKPGKPGSGSGQSGGPLLFKLPKDP